MKSRGSRGAVYWCPICDARIAVLARDVGEFDPRCCNTAMVLVDDKLDFYFCPICGAEIAALRQSSGERFCPRCCNLDMVREAA